MFIKCPILKFIYGTNLRFLLITQFTFRFAMNPFEWENEADIDPEILYQYSEKVEE